MVDVVVRSYISSIVTDSSPGAADAMLHIDPESLRKHVDCIGRFRILVIGRSNAGKTTLLQRVCNTTELPEVYNAKGEKVGCLTAQYWQVMYDYSPARSYGCARVFGGVFHDFGTSHQQTNSAQRGDHDIENELIFRNNPRFVFHDSQGFESGSVSELELMKRFVADRATRKQLAQRIHAIW